MDALGGGGFWGMSSFLSHHHQRGRRRERGERSKPSDSSESTGRVSGGGYRFPLKQAVTAGCLALTGDTIAQLGQRYKNTKSLSDSHDSSIKDAIWTLLSDHDWLRALRMTSYGLLLYGPGSYAWYQYLDRTMPKQSVQNLLLKVLLNQVILGPCVIAVVFAWNFLWQGKLSELPNKYQKDAIPTLFSGFRFWIPVSVLNFWVVPLQARVAFMSLGSIFWNFCLSSTLSK